MAVTAHVVDIEEIGQAEFSRQNLDSLPWHFTLGIEPAAILLHLAAAERNCVAKDAPRQIRRPAEVGTSHHVEVCETGEAGASLIPCPPALSTSSSSSRLRVTWKPV